MKTAHICLAGAVIAIGVVICIWIGFGNAKHDPRQVTIEKEEIRFQNLVGPAPTIEKIHQVLGVPDDVYDGEPEYKHELFYGKLSSIIDVIVIVSRERRHDSRGLRN